MDVTSEPRTFFEVRVRLGTHLASELLKMLGLRLRGSQEEQLA
jgi:hypothetical protein